MSKHRLSPSLHILPPPKRRRASVSDPTEENDHAEERPATNDSCFGGLYDELILYIFSYLDHTDLCVSTRVSQNWHRLSSENLLWRSLYCRIFSKPRLRGSRGHIRRADGRAVRPIPGGANTDKTVDWKWMFRISHNWKKGRCALREIGPDSSDNTAEYSTHVLLLGSLVIAASAGPSLEPKLHISGANVNCTLPCSSTHPGPPCFITALVQDQSPPGHDGARLVAFLSTGEFVQYILDPENPSAARQHLIYVPRGRSNRTTPILQAVYHHPLLIALSQSFHLSIYNVSSDRIEHTQTLTSFTSYPPSSLVLSVPSPAQYKLVMAYAIPVYPNHFSVGSTELIIPSPQTPSSLESMSVTSSRSARAIDIPQGWIDEVKYRSMREQWDRKVSQVAACQTDGRWVVLAAQDPLLRSASSNADQGTLFTSSMVHSSSVLQLYRLSYPSSTTGKPKLTFVRTLNGQTEPVSALMLADGRCVSLGVTGSIWVWDLEADDGAQVAHSQPLGKVSTLGAVTFDDRRIISTSGDGIVSVRSFDI